MTEKDLQQATENSIEVLHEMGYKITPQKPFLKIIDDYYIKYGDEGELFSMHKPADIRSLIRILNRDNGYSELQCEYNDLEAE